MTRRRGSASLVANPVLVGAVTVLVTVIAVVLAYNANRGLPFVPTLDAKVRSDSGAQLTPGSEVREGGLRVGFVKTIRTVTLADGTAAAEMAVQLNRSAGDIPPDTRFTIRPRSPLGLKYLEMVRGRGETKVQDGHVFPPSQTFIPVQVDDFNRIYDEPTRQAVQRNFEGFGNALAGRGTSVNEALENLPRLFRHVAPVARNLSDPQTRLGRFFRELGDAARVVAPLAATQADLFTRTALTFEAISSDPEALKETISRSHPAFQAGIESFPVQRPFLTDSARLARAMQPVARELRPTLPLINDALETGTPVTRRSVDMYGRLRPALVSLRDLMRDPATGRALRGLRTQVTSLAPQLRYLGPYQTVCNSWNYYFTYLAEHVSQSTPFGLGQRAQIKSTGQQSNGPGSMGSVEPGNGEGYVEATRARGAPAHLHGTVFNAAIDDNGNADCENGQRGYVRRLSRFGAEKYQINTDYHFPGNSGPTYSGRARVPRGQTYTREPQTGEVHEP
jgi:ABC-type transporter Mla subunit MlaD